ncbi:hypothetical protein B0H12DRAFT_1129430 [Mycena haematopus]|nr:hypothetical protein B0H12DRAFT_1129430 [Mycena haematopus]
MAKLASFILIAAAALTPVIAAHIPRTAQSSCASVLENILSSSNPGFSCLAPNAFADIIDLGTQNASVASFGSAIDKWLTEFCAAGPCSADTLDQISNLTAGCSDFDGTAFAAAFPESRELLCLKDTTANTFCATEALMSGVNETATANTNTTGATPEDVLLGLVLASSGFGTCTQCTKAQYQVSVKFGQTDSSGFEDDCGADFSAQLNSTAVGIEQTAVTSESKNGAGAVTPTNLLILLAVFGFCALLQLSLVAEIGESCLLFDVE